MYLWRWFHTGYTHPQDTAVEASDEDIQEEEEEEEEINNVQEQHIEQHPLNFQEVDDNETKKKTNKRKKKTKKKEDKMMVLNQHQTRRDGCPIQNQSHHLINS